MNGGYSRFQPKNLWKRYFYEIYDAGKHFKIMTYPMHFDARKVIDFTLQYCSVLNQQTPNEY